MATFPARLAYYDQEVSSRGPAGAVATHMPRLASGVAAAALHPLIHTGWALEAGSGDMLARGLAYLDAAGTQLGTPAHPGVPTWVPPPAGRSPLAATRAFAAAAQEHNLPRAATEAAESPAYKDLGRGGFQHRVLAFADPALPHAAVLARAGPLQLPPVDTPLASAVVAATTLAAAALRASDCEFFVLHALTSLHATLAVVAALAPADGRELLGFWWRASMAALTAQHLPAADALLARVAAWEKEVGGEEQVAAGTSDASAYGEANAAADAAEVLSGDEGEFWRDVLERGLTSEDEHVPKAVYALWRWSCFHGMPAASRRLFREAAANQVRPVSGNVSETLWFSSAKAHEPPRRRQEAASASESAE